MIFPPILGLLVLALAWRAAIGQFALPPGLSGLLDGVAMALFLFAAMAYLGKLCRRPAVVVEDRAILPGRVGVACGVLSLYAAGAVLLPYMPGGARLFVVAGLAAQIGLMLSDLPMMQGTLWTRRPDAATAPPSAARLSPAWQLDWAGLLVAAAAFVALGLPGMGQMLLWPGALAALMIWLASVRQAALQRMPAPLRPLLMLHLVPLAAFGVAASGIGLTGAAQIAGVAAAAVLLAGLAASRWLLADRQGLFRSTLAIPLSLSALLFWQLQAQNPSPPLRLSAALVLIAATLLTARQSFAVMRDWARGRLAQRSNAAVA